MSSPPRVLVLLYRQEGYDRAILRGIARYSQLHGPWLFYVSNDLPGLPEALPEMFISYDDKRIYAATSQRTQIRAVDFRRWGIAGVIGRLQTIGIAKHIERARLPMVAMDLSRQQSEKRSDNPQLAEMKP
ncbi:MAG: hypothetical protein ACIALR_05770, partial [Blastopirellula sp. JB062]